MLTVIKKTFVLTTYSENQKKNDVSTNFSFGLM